MAVPNADLHHPWADPPSEGTAVPVADGLFWTRVRLPFALDHVNLWLLADDDGWLAIDAGLNAQTVHAAWDALAGAVLGGRPVTRVLVTHFHPDHMGAAGWLCGRWDAPLLMARTEYLQCRTIWGTGDAEVADETRRWARRLDLPAEVCDRMAGRGNPYRPNLSPPPDRFVRVRGGDTLAVGGRRWTVMIGRGHAPEMVCLFDGQDRILIAADQILPTITPNVSVWPQEPNADPLGDFVESLGSFATLPAGTLVLPSHGLPFRGIASRIARLTAHHAERLDTAEAACARPRTVGEVMGVLFPRPLDPHQTTFAAGETLAHLNRLAVLGRLRGSLRGDRLVFGPR
jgi:glyoxylase-like metal-dependent hydrolase (beta-lactamase superfamily II)